MDGEILSIRWGPRQTQKVLTVSYERKRPRLDPCPVEAVLDLVRGKWKARIIRALADQPRTFGALRKHLGRVTQQVLAAQLKELEADGLVERHRNGPDAIDGSTYRLSDQAKTLLPALEALALWGAERLRREGLTWPGEQGPLSHR